MHTLSTLAKLIRGMTGSCRRSVLIFGLVVIGSQVLAGEVKMSNSAWDKMPLYFVEGYGPSAGKAAYQTLSGSQPAYFTSTGVWLTQRSVPSKDGLLPAAGRLQPTEYHPQAQPDWALKLEFLGARETTPQARAPLEAKINYFHGKPEQWRTGLSSYGELVYSSLWPGVDLHYRGAQGRLKSTFTVQPGADPRRIQLAWRGADKVTVSDAGRLQIETPIGVLEEEKPVAWQEWEGQRRPVAVSYQTEADLSGGWRHGFAVGSYDPNLPLIIDPVTLAYSGFIGGSGDDVATGIAVDDTGAAYVAGYVNSSTTFPTTPGAIALGHAYDANNTWDSFVVKIKPDGSGLVYAGIFGGSAGDQPSGIAVDGTGAAYISGTTFSSDFPTKGTLGTVYHGDSDAFVVKINPEGSNLMYAGLVGGYTADRSTAIAIDNIGAAYLTGCTQSSDFPTVGGLGRDYRNDCDAFVVKVRADGSALAYAGLLAGNSAEQGSSIAVDREGAAYVTGYSLSTDFPIMDGLGVAPPDPSKGSRPFVSKVRPDGTGLIYSTFLDSFGGGNAIAVDQAGAAYITGMGSVTNFPIMAGFPPSSSSADSFVVKLKPEGSGIAYARTLTRLGGFCMGWACDYGKATAITVDSSGAAYLTGYIHSNNPPFPLINWAGKAPNISYESTAAFLMKVQTDGSGVVYAGVLGGVSNKDINKTRATGIAVDARGAAYITGTTNTADFPVVGGPNLSYRGNGDAFVAKIAETTKLTPIAVIDSYKAYMKQRLVVEGPGVLSNDLSPGGEALTASVANAPTKGTLRLQADGGFSYEPASTGGGIVTDRFDYIAHNSVGSSTPAAVMLKVSAPPGTYEDTYQVFGDGPWASSGSVLNNDSNIIPDMVEVVVKKKPSHGRVEFHLDGFFTYTPEQGYRGRDQFTYVIKYGSGRSKPTRVILNVVDPPR